MFPGYDPERKPPYTHVVRYLYNGQIHETTYIVSRGYADSVTVTSTTERVENEK
tara:strand:- start:2844 stop:3005 length:162 start_codon:yes stop_codon:yes gene_type:complete